MSVNSNSKVSRIFLICVGIFLLLNVSNAFAGVMTYWKVSSGNWNDSGNWTVAVPTINDNAFFYNGGVATVNQAGSACDLILLGGAYSGTIEITDGSLSSNNAVVGNTGTGAINQSAGTNTVSALCLAQQSGSDGTYTLNGTGALSAKSEWIGYEGAGTFTQSGGTNTASNNIYLGMETVGNGTYILDGPGQLAAYSELVGYNGTGIFLHSAGTNTVSLYLSLGESAGSTGTYNLSGTGLTVSPKEFVGEAGTGFFNHTAGVNTVYNSLYLGYRAGAVGTYNLGGTGQLSVPTEYIGSSGTGSFNQTGGTHNIINSLILGETAGASGTYTLTGGTLKLKSISIGEGSAEFNFGGGTLQARWSFSTNVPMTLTGIGGNANVDTVSYNVGLTGVLSGTGGLTKLGSGKLTLDSLNTYGGDTIVKSGTLEIAGGIDTGGTTLIDVQSGKAIFKTVNVSKTILDLNTAALGTFEVVDGTHTVGTISGGGITQVDSNARLTAASINQGKLTIGSGAVVVIQPIAGGPLSGKITAVPEQSSFVILVGCFVIWAWKRKSF